MLLKQNLRETLRLQWLIFFPHVSISLASSALAVESSCTSSYSGSIFKANFHQNKALGKHFQWYNSTKKTSGKHQAIILYFLEKLESHQLVCSVEWVWLIASTVNCSIFPASSNMLSLAARWHSAHSTRWAGYYNLQATSLSIPMVINMPSQLRWPCLRKSDNLGLLSSTSKEFNKHFTN